MSLDVKTVIFLSSIAAIVMGISILGTAQNYPHIKGVTKWAWGCAVQSLAWILIFLRGSISEFFSVIVAYTLLLLSMTFFYHALTSFKGKKFSSHIFYPLIALSSLLLSFFTYVYYQSLMRTLVIAVLGSILSFLCSYLLLRKKGETPKISERIMGLGFFVIGMSPIITVLSIVVNIYKIDLFFPNSIIQNLNFAFIFIAILILTSSFMLMINDKFMGEILRLATMDSLTGIYNRAAIEQLILKEIDRSKRYNLPMSLLLLDLDHFKKINDTYGHQVGDHTLQKLVETVSQVLRDHDLFGRFGGEEFTILLPETDLVNGHIVAERIRNIVDKTPIKTGSKSFGLTISIGLATLNHQDDDFAELFRRADMGLYKAKQSGRNRVVAVRDKNIKLETLEEEDFQNFKSNPNIEIPQHIKRNLK